jgi:hypothetical protein
MFDFSDKMENDFSLFFISPNKKIQTTKSEQPTTQKTPVASNLSSNK